MCRLLLPSAAAAAAAPGKLRVVTTLTTYADVAREVGGERVEAQALVEGNQDPHFVRPRPSLAETLARADLFVSTGLDLELWVEGLLDLSQNQEIRSGQRRFVSAAQGVALLEIPKVLSQSEGHVHVYGNPHFMLSPPAIKQVALNIAAGLSKIDPEHAAEYSANAKRYGERLDELLVGKELLHILGATTVQRLLARPDRFVEFLQKKQYKGAPLIDRLGGWMAAAMPLRGKRVVAYHRSWSYFSDLFGLQVVNFIEPRPGVPPRAEHVAAVVDQMRNERIGVIIAANYYDEGHVREIAERVGAKAVIVPLYPGGASGVDSFPALLDHLLSSFNQALGTQPAGKAAP
jgi:ABC-type Zn uptake system ZnuABC Zn-binding protein ZnuA